MLVQIEIKDAFGKEPSNISGEKLYSVLSDAAKKGDQVTLSFDGIPYVTKRFIIDSLGKIYIERGREWMTKNIKIEEANILVKDMIKAVSSECLDYIDRKYRLL